MRALIQRVAEASVKIDNRSFSAISKGLLVLIGIEEADNESDIAWLSGKICNLRIFNDAAGIMNLSIKDVAGEILLVSQFTLHASTRKGSRPSYMKAAKPGTAVPLYEQLIRQLYADLGKAIQTGSFGADMQVTLVNDGPVTIMIDTRNKE